jgi:hypothetical protein
MIPSGRKDQVLNFQFRILFEDNKYLPSMKYKFRMQWKKSHVVVNATGVMLNKPNNVFVVLIDIIGVSLL